MTDDDLRTRVRYFDGQFLRVDDFQEEQRYHLGEQRRHHVSGHTWGIVSGLDVTATSRAVQVSAGSAVDVLGRAIVLDHQTTLALDTRAQTFNVWIRHEEVETDQVDDDCAGVGARRVQERARVELDSNVDPPGTDADPSPGDSRHSQVFLGRVELDPLRRDDPPVVRLAARRYTGLVGTSVDAPSGAASLRFSGGPGRGGGPGVFEVLATPPPDPATADPLAPRPVLTVSGTGRAKLAGDLTVEGSLTLDGDMLVFGALPSQTDAASLAAAAAAQQSAVADPASTTGAAAATALEQWSVRQVAGPPPQLQIVLPSFDPAIDKPAAGFAIGTWSADTNGFKPLLTVHADGNVVIPGTLRVGGLVDLNGDPLPDGAIVDGGLDPEATRMVSAAGMSGIAGGSGLAARMYRPGTGGVLSAVQPPVQPLSIAEAATGESADDAGRPERGLARALAATLAADETLVTELAATLSTERPEVAAALRAALPYRRPPRKK